MAPESQKRNKDAENENLQWKVIRPIAQSKWQAVPQSTYGPVDIKT